MAALVENELIVEYIATNFRQTLKVGDNVSTQQFSTVNEFLIRKLLQLERTALHYSMGINNVEAISRILIKNGAERVLKNLKKCEETKA